MNQTELANRIGCICSARFLGLKASWLGAMENTCNGSRYPLHSDGDDCTNSETFVPNFPNPRPNLIQGPNN